MLSAAKVMSFLAVTEAEKATSFYRDVLGLVLVGADEFALIFDCNGTTLRISPVPGAKFAPYTVFGWEVADIRAEIGELVGKGVAFERFEGLPLDEDAVCTFPNGDMVAWFKDPDGNVLSLAQFPK